MSLIDTKKIRNLISFHEKQISILNSLIEISSAIEKAKPLSAKMISDISSSGLKAAAPARKPSKKRGKVSQSVLEMLSDSKKALSSGEIKSKLVKKGLAKKESSSVYTLLLQMFNRGAIKKLNFQRGWVIR